MKPDYCTQNDGDCETCSLVNNGRDCKNNPIEPDGEKNRVIDDKPAKNPHIISGEVGGFIGAVAGYLAKDAVITGSGFWSRPLFVGGAAMVGALVGMVLYYIWEKCFKIWEKYFKRFYE